MFVFCSKNKQLCDWLATALTYCSFILVHMSEAIYYKIHGVLRQIPQFRNQYMLIDGEIGPSMSRSASLQFPMGSVQLAHLLVHN